MTGLSGLVYRGMLRLYPTELRRDFGPEMMEVFADDLADGWRTCGFAGACLVWWCVLCEFFRIAIPHLRGNPIVAVPVTSFVLNALVVRGELMLGNQSIGQAVTGAGLICALTALVVVLSGKVSVISLQLNAADK
jgi:hypothetical protein